MIEPLHDKNREDFPTSIPRLQRDTPVAQTKTNLLAGLTTFVTSRTGSNGIEN